VCFLGAVLSESSGGVSSVVIAIIIICMCFYYNIMCVSMHAFLITFHFISFFIIFMRFYSDSDSGWMSPLLFLRCQSQSIDTFKRHTKWKRYTVMYMSLHLCVGFMSFKCIFYLCA